jgi:inorganic pyrophosphatase
MEFSRGGRPVSPWHDVQLRRPGGTFNFVNEIPKGTREKLEIDTKGMNNVIKQDLLKKTKALRSFTYGDIPFNYGCLPRTFEDPLVADPHTGFLGDGDPVDVVELSPTPLPVGDISEVRVVGVLAMIDEGEMDWKVFAVPVSSSIHTIDDVPAHVVNDVRHWFRFYKTTDGKGENEFAFDGVACDATLANDVITHCSKQYEALVQGNTSHTKFWLR